MLRNFVLTISEGPALDESTMRANEDRIRRGEQQRAVYPASALSSPQGQRWMTVWDEVGEDQRILPTTDTEFAVFGDDRGRGSGRLGRPRARATPSIRDPLTVKLYTAYFDLAWKHAVPAPARRRVARAPATPSSSSCSSWA